MNDRPMVECVICKEAGVWTKLEMARHVAVRHSEGTYSTFSCGVCGKKYYDMQHFHEHLLIDSDDLCSAVPCKIAYVALPEHIERAFHALIEQMIRPVNNMAENRYAIDGGMQQQQVLKSNVFNFRFDDADKPPISNITSADVIEKCKSILQTRNVTINGTLIQCRICECLITNTPLDAAVRVAVRHACAHRPRTLHYQCDLCGRSVFHLRAFRAHLTRIHGRPHEEASVDRVDLVKSTDAVMEIFRGCFDFGDDGTMTPGNNNAVGCRNGDDDDSGRDTLQSGVSGKETNNKNNNSKTFVGTANEPAGSYHGRERGIAQLTAMASSALNKTSPFKSQLTDTNWERQLHCRQLIFEHAESKSGRITCRVCQTSLRVFRGNSGLKTRTAMNHALKHVGRPTCRCLRCDVRTLTPIGMHYHISEKHRIRAEDGVTFEDFADQYHPAIMEMLDRCFNGAGEMVPGNSGGKAAAAAAIEVGAEQLINNDDDDNSDDDDEDDDANTSSTGAERQILAHRLVTYGLELMRRFITDGGACITCRLCSKSIRVVRLKRVKGRRPYNTLDGYTLTQHVLVHIKRRSYRCLLCNVETYTKGQFNNHVRICHRWTPSIADIREDLTTSCRAQREIMQRMAECFDYDIPGTASSNTEERAASGSGSSAQDLSAAGSASSTSNCSEETSTALELHDQKLIPYVCQRCGYRTISNSLYHDHMKMIHD